MSKKRIYLDWNATAPPLESALEAMLAAARDAWGNPASVHAHGRAARASVEAAREAVAKLAGADPRDVVLTSGGTEANNLALRSLSRGSRGPDPARRVDEAGRPLDLPVLLTSRLEHPSVARVAEALEREGAARVRWLRVAGDGRLDLADLERALEEEPRPALLALQSVNAETGVVQPVAEAAALARARGARVHVDAVQEWGKLELRYEADTRSLAAHKFRGPKGIGALVARPGLHLSPVLVGGSQERGLRPGTVDPVGAAGLAAAARHAMEAPARWARLAPLRDRLEAALLAMHPGAEVNGGPAPRAPHVTSLGMPGWSGPELVAALDLEGVSCSAGSACSAGSFEPPGAVAAAWGEGRAASTVRLSMGETTTEADVEAAIEAFRTVLARGGAGFARGHAGKA